MVCKFVKEYYDFAMACAPTTPMTGEHAIIPIARWFASLADRGPSVPRAGRYALRVFGEALGADFPLSHPAVIAAARFPKTKPTKRAPPSPLEFIKSLEYAAVNEELPESKRIFVP